VEFRYLGAPWVKALEPLAPTLPYDLAVTDGGAPAAELGKITAPVLILGGRNSPPWFQRSVADQAAPPPARSSGCSTASITTPPSRASPRS
jgi:hypothetical protein